LLTLRVEAETMAGAYLAAVESLSAPPLPAGDVNELPKEEQRRLIREEMARKRRSGRAR